MELIILGVVLLGVLLATIGEGLALRKYYKWSGVMVLGGMAISLIAIIIYILVWRP